MDQKTVFPVWSKTKERHHWIQHNIRNDLGTKFQLKETILSFWTKFAQKSEYFLILCKNSFHYRVWQKDFTHSFWAFLKKFMTKCGKQRKFHQLHINLLQRVTKIYYKVWQVSQCDTKIIAKCDRYYKVWQSLQSEM